MRRLRYYLLSPGLWVTAIVCLIAMAPYAADGFMADDSRSKSTMPLSSYEQQFTNFEVVGFLSYAGKLGSDKPVQHSIWHVRYRQVGSRYLLETLLISSDKQFLEQSIYRSIRLLSDNSIVETTIGGRSEPYVVIHPPNNHNELDDAELVRVLASTLAIQQPWTLKNVAWNEPTAISSGMVKTTGVRNGKPISVITTTAGAPLQIINEEPENPESVTRFEDLHVVDKMPVPVPWFAHQVFRSANPSAQLRVDLKFIVQSVRVLPPDVDVNVEIPIGSRVANLGRGENYVEGGQLNTEEVSRLNEDPASLEAMVGAPIKNVP